MSYLTGKESSVLIVDHHVKKNYVCLFTRTVRKALDALSDKNKA